MIRKYKNKKWLENEVKKKSLNLIAFENNCNIGTMRGWCGRHEIKPTNNYPSSKLLNHIKITKDLRYLLNGSLLGDGGITPTSPYAAILAFSYKEKEYVNFIVKNIVLLE